MEVSVYQYSALPSQSSFRLLVLEPGTNEAVIECHLLESNLVQPPPYEALSYVWGDSSINFEISCDGEPLTITQNLRYSLLRLRLQDRQRLLWADAICINQEDMEERSQQVKKMRQIYGGASRVVIWLSLDQEGFAEAAVNAVNAITNACFKSASIDPSVLPGIDNLYSIAVADAGPGRDRSLGIDPKGWTALRWLHTRAWFTRTWVLQAVNAGIPSIVLCGLEEVTWGHVGLAATYLWAWEDALVPFIGEFRSLTAFQMRRKERWNTWNILETLHAARELRATDPRDKIYGTLGMSAFVKSNIDLTPDYTISMMELYREFASSSISLFDNLDVLSFIEHHTSADLNYTSWVPRWDRPPFINRRSDKTGDASGGRLPKISQVDHTGLLIDGIRFNDHSI